MSEILKSPYMMVKPYTAQHLGLLAETISKNGLSVKTAFTIDQWAQAARGIYQKNIDREGQQFQIGLEGHIKLVNHFFGNNALVLFVEGNGQKEQNIQETLYLAQSAKREFRKILPAGQNLQDIVVMMNLDEVGIGCETGIFPTGVIGIQTTESGFRKVSPHKGRWDYFYFKYIHVADDLTGLFEEINILDRMGILDKSNEITLEDFTVMAKLKTLIPPKKFRELP